MFRFGNNVIRYFANIKTRFSNNQTKNDTKSRKFSKKI